MTSARRHRRDERGAVLPIMAMLIATVIVIASFGVDIGMQRVARRDMQTVADTVALDMARLIDGRTRAQIEAGTGATPAKKSFADTLAASLDRNTSTAVGGTPTVNAYLVKATNTGAYPADASGKPTQVLAGEVPNVVAVVAETSVGFVFGGVTGVKRGAAQRSAVAWAAKPTLCFSVGTRGLALDTSGSALSPLLDYLLRVKLGAIGYTGLVDAKNIAVPLAQLTAQLGVGTVDQLATTSVTISQLALATVNAVKAETPTADVSALNSLLNLPLSVPAVTLGSILDLTTGGPTAGLVGDINALDLLTASIVAANKNAAIDAALVVPGVAGVSLTITQPPKIGCGSPDATPRPFSESAQISLAVTSSLGATAALGVADGSIALKLLVGSGKATLTGLSCTPESATFDVETGTATVPSDQSLVKLNVTLAKFLSVIPGLGLVLKLALQALGLDPIGLNVKVGAALISSSKTGVVLTYPPAPALPPTYTISGSNGSVVTLTAADVELDTSAGGVMGLLGALLNPTLAALTTSVVTPLLNTVVSPLLSSIVNPLLSALGITLGNTDVNVQGRPECQAVQLVG